ncbi:hypothetical protein [Vannielia sp.]|uniref:hypothetical protein n=1 Tax=Vannielia sp. TaxID=2813045 RepID=UPI00261C3A57|nr:hypothetical protein [Vannielia sp.]MDF1873233.1 hypothetical protein [Vannielia sp.]
MPVLVDYPPPPDIDFGLCQNPREAEKELNQLLDACAECAAVETTVRAAIAGCRWVRILHAGPASEVFQSPSELKLSLSIRSKGDLISVKIGSQKKG